MCMPQILHGYIYNHKKERIVKYLKLKFKWISVFLFTKSGNFIPRTLRKIGWVDLVCIQMKLEQEIIHGT